MLTTRNALMQLDGAAGKIQLCGMQAAYNIGAHTRSVSKRVFSCLNHECVSEAFGLAGSYVQSCNRNTLTIQAIASASGEFGRAITIGGQCA